MRKRLFILFRHPDRKVLFHHGIPIHITKPNRFSVSEDKSRSECQHCSPLPVYRLSVSRDSLYSLRSTAAANYIRCIRALCKRLFVSGDLSHSLEMQNLLQDTVRVISSSSCMHDLSPMQGIFQKPLTLNPDPSTSSSKNSILESQIQPSTLDPQPSTLCPQPSALVTHP